ncbi:YeiH family protein [Kingella pumchi]|uniref:Sulfate exporter family transporter n=1 Tax=Kingella pumchi TaxID=2779506 RepID=A0ABS9NLS2_9NEIS|nr:putative sulfate exporter family transporter [Kingella pumchi]MCG6503268.1 putative sulfate exporter family transporter [Kingella pumchi]
MLPLSRLWQLIPPTLAAVLCMYLAALPPLAQNGISPLTLAIVLGMALGNSVAAPHLPRIAEGIAFSKGRLLRLGIVLYGFKITWAQLAFAGWPALFADVGVVCGTFALALWLGRRLGMERDTAALVGAGSAICGAAAVLAAQPVLKAKEADVGVAVATVVVFGTLAMFVYPLLAALLLPSVADADACFGWGIYTGASVHEVAQVADVAVITKMIRVLLLAPFLLALPWLMRRFGGGAPAAQKGAPALPWFALGFLGAVAANSPLLLAGMLALWLLLGGGTLSYLALRLFA